MTSSLISGALRRTPVARDTQVATPPFGRNSLLSKSAKRTISLTSLVSSWSFRSRSEEHTSELQSLMRISYAVFCLKQKKKNLRLDNTHSLHNKKRITKKNATSDHRK